MVGRIQVPPVAVLLAEVRVAAVVERVCDPVVNWVDVTWMFQPALLPVRSDGVNVGCVVAVLFVPLRVVLKLTDDVARVSDPPVHVGTEAKVAMAPSHPTEAETVEVCVSDGVVADAMGCL